MCKILCVGFPAVISIGISIFVIVIILISLKAWLFRETNAKDFGRQIIRCFLGGVIGNIILMTAIQVIICKQPAISGTALYFGAHKEAFTWLTDQVKDISAKIDFPGLTAPTTMTSSKTPEAFWPKPEKEKMITPNNCCFYPQEDSEVKQALNLIHPEGSSIWGNDTDRMYHLCILGARMEFKSLWIVGLTAANHCSEVAGDFARNVYESLAQDLLTLGNKINATECQWVRIRERNRLSGNTSNYFIGEASTIFVTSEGAGGGGNPEAPAVEYQTAPFNPQTGYIETTKTETTKSAIGTTYELDQKMMTARLKTESAIKKHNKMVNAIGEMTPLIFKKSFSACVHSNSATANKLQSYFDSKQ